MIHLVFGLKFCDLPAKELIGKKKGLVDPS